jgi:hypothetical protein
VQLLETFSIQGNTAGIAALLEKWEAALHTVRYSKLAAKSAKANKSKSSGSSQSQKKERGRSRKSQGERSESPCPGRGEKNESPGIIG